MKTQTKESIWTGWKGALAVILFAVIMALLFCSCSSKSDHLISKYEKCVVLDTSYPTYYVLTYSEGYKYRIQRIENQGTITTMYNPNLWHTGDTILLRFSQIVNEDN